MKRNYYKGIVNILLELHKDHPTYEMGKHLELAFSEYPQPWGIPDKEMYTILRKYQDEILQEIDITEDYIDQIVREGLDLEHILDENEEDDV